MIDVAPLTTAHRYPLRAGRELLVMGAEGLVFLSIHGIDGACMTGPLGIRLEDVAAVCQVLAKATGAELAGDMEGVRQVLRASPGIAGYKRLRRDLTGMSMARRRAAVQALQDAGELVDRGEHRRPRLYIAPKPGYSHRNPAQPVGVDMDPCQHAKRAKVDAYVAPRAQSTGEADVTSAEGTR